MLSAAGGIPMVAIVVNHATIERHVADIRPITGLNPITASMDDAFF
jgi:hypothetical protein